MNRVGFEAGRRVLSGHRAVINSIDAAYAWIEDPKSDAIVRRIFWLLFGLAIGLVWGWAL